MRDSSLVNFESHVSRFERGRGGFFRRRYRNARTGLRFPWFSLLIVLTLAICLKAFIVLRVGEDRYAARFSRLEISGVGDKVGAFLMQPDPVSSRIQEIARPILKKRRR